MQSSKQRGRGNWHREHGRWLHEPNEARLLKRASTEDPERVQITELAECSAFDAGHISGVKFSDGEYWADQNSLWLWRARNPALAERPKFEESIVVQARKAEAARKAAARAEAKATTEAVKVKARDEAAARKAKAKAAALTEATRARVKALAEAERIRESNYSDHQKARAFSEKSWGFYRHGKERLTYNSRTIGYTKHPEISFAQQIRDHLGKHGASTGREIGHGILKHTRDHMFVTTEISTALQRMEKSGVVTRDKRKMGSYWSLVPGRDDGRRLRLKRGDKIAKALLSWVIDRARGIVEEIRGDVISEVFLRLSTGLFSEAQAESVFDRCVRLVRKQGFGLYKREVSLDEPFGDDSDGDSNDGTLLTVIPSDALDTDGLYKVEAQVEQLMHMEGDGYMPEQTRHLYESSGTSWLHRANV